MDNEDTVLQSLRVQGVLKQSCQNGILSTQGCPCGYFGSSRECKCSPMQIQRYVGKISGPLMDRIDIHIDVPAVKFKELRGELARGRQFRGDSRTGNAGTRDSACRDLTRRRRGERFFKLRNVAKADSHILRTRRGERGHA